MAFDAAICPACRFAPALGEQIPLSPPRAARPDPEFELPPLRRMQLRKRWRWWHLAAFALVPGLGHYLDHQPRLAGFFALAIAGGLLLSKLLQVPGLSILLVAIAAGLHAWSIVDHTPWRRAELIPRLVALVVCNLICGLFWSLILGFGSTFRVAYVRGSYRDGLRFDSATTLLGLLLALGIAFILARWLLHRRR